MFEIKNYGTGRLGDIEISDGLVDNFNSYAAVTKIDELADDKIAVDTDSGLIGAYEKFTTF